MNSFWKRQFAFKTLQLRYAGRDAFGCRCWRVQSKNDFIGLIWEDELLALNPS